MFDDIMKKAHDFPSPEWDPISDDAKELLNQMMSKDPADRISSADCLTGRNVQPQ